MKCFKRLTAASLILALLCSFSGCVGLGENDDGLLKIVCTIFPQYDFVRQIVGNKAEIIMLVSPGEDTHSLDPTSQQILDVSEADLFIRIDPDFEVWSETLINSAENDSLKVLNLADELKLTATHDEHDHDHAADGASDAHDEDAAHEEEHADEDKTEEGFTTVPDYHIWTSPNFAVRMVDAICTAISDIDKANTDFYSANSQKYIEDIRQVDTELTYVCANSKRNIIAFAGRFAIENFTNEYKLFYTSLFDSCTEDSNPDASRVAQLIDSVKTNKIPAVFCEELGANYDTAQSIADETGTQVMEFHSCHNLSKEDFLNGETYVSLMKKNLEALKIALN